MTRSIYVVGGAGAGKSTFTGQLIDGMEHEPLTELHTTPIKNGDRVPLRGHRLRYGEVDGVYLGVLRDSFPGSDGLARTSGVPGEEWLQTGELPSFLISEGATLATRRFLSALHQATDMLLIHLHASDEVKIERFAERESAQDPKFVRGSATRAFNRMTEALEAGAVCLSIDSTDEGAWELGLDLARGHLRLTRSRVDSAAAG